MDEPTAITLIWILALGALLVLSSLASYVRLLLRRLTLVSAMKVFHPDSGRWVKADREQVGVSLSALHGAAMGAFAVGVAALMFLARPADFIEDVVISLLVVLCAVAVGDHLIPFLLVARHDEPEEILARWKPSLRLAVYLALPLTFPIWISTTIGRLLVPADAETQAGRPQEELQDLIAAGEQEGLIEKGEGELMQSMAKFGDKVVREVMTPRPEIAALDIDAPLEELRRFFREKRLTRYPVYSGQLDHVEGIVSLRDVMQLPSGEEARVTLRSLVRPVPFVPETKPVKDLLKELQQTTTQMAIVIDEYGSVSGLVTIEDMVEEIVGDIRDEVDPHARDIVRETADTYVVAGNTELAQIADQLHVAIEDGDYSTVAGLMIARLGHVPSPGEKVEMQGAAFEVLEANPRAVVKVRLRIFSPRAATSHAGPHAV